MIVVDASIAVKWMLWEDDTFAALDFLRRNGGNLCAPDTMFTEVAHAIVRHANLVDRQSRTEVTVGALEALRKWTITWGRHAVRAHRVTQSRLYDAGRMALDLGHPLPDCIYLRLAMDLGCDLATSDAKFRAKALPLYPAIRMLEDYA